MKKRGGGKSKGSSFERKVAHMLDDWWELPKDTLWRTVNSGGWKQPGDIYPRISSTPVWFPFVVECKHYRTVNLWEILKGNKNAKIIDWWKQVTVDQGKCKEDKKPIRLLIFRQNNYPVFVAFDSSEVREQWKDIAHLPPPHLKLQFFISPSPIPQKITIISWKQFSRCYKKDNING
jgi:hypothetical protein